MSGKRGAGCDLNHDNWDAEDDVEEAGSFQKAPDEVLRQRVMKTARRRGPPATNSGISSDASGDKRPAAFGGFTAFSSFAPPNPNAAFSFLSNTNTVKTASTSTAPVTSPFAPKTSETITNGIESKAEKKQSISLFSAPPAPESSKPVDVTKALSSTDKDMERREEYYAKLKGLNESVLKWIEKHVKENPLISLKPIFADYERYLNELEIKYIEVSPETKKELSGFSFKSATPPKSTSTSAAAPLPPTKSIFSTSTSVFGNSSEAKKPASKPADVPKYTFGDATKEPEKPTFLFGGANASKSGADISKPFTFGSMATSTTTPASSSIFSATPATFSFLNTPAGAKTTTTDTVEPQAVDDEEDEPPKVEFTPVVEKDHVYTIRCKVFVKKDGNFGDRGVGNLFLKPVPNSEKMQLIVRADTNLGNLLLNFILSSAVPTQRMGKKDVMCVCVPLPEAQPPPVPVLLRVKSGEEADALLKELEKHKK